MTSFVLFFISTSHLQKLEAKNITKSVQTGTETITCKIEFKKYLEISKILEVRGGGSRTDIKTLSTDDHHVPYTVIHQHHALLHNDFRGGQNYHRSGSSVVCFKKRKQMDGFHNDFQTKTNERKRKKKRKKQQLRTVMTLGIYHSLHYIHHVIYR